MNKAVLLDRDGTIIEDRNYIKDPNDVVTIPGTRQGLRALQRAGYLLIVVTNQSGIGRGFFTEQDLWRVHERLSHLLSLDDVNISKYYVCPHRPEDNCSCRKPKAELFLTAVEQYDLDIKQSWIIGDKTTDMIPARLHGFRQCLITNRTGREVYWEAHIIAPNLLQAAKKILGLR